MNSFELNKIAGAVLGTCLFAMGTGVIADLVFETHAPARPGFAIQVAEAKTDPNATAPAVAAEPMGVRLAAADATRGAAVFKACAACHTAEKGGAAKIGPNLWGVVNRDVAAVPGFAFSPAMASHAGEWTYDQLDQFLTKPSAFVPGTKMSYAGLARPDARADLVAYLRSLADAPAPLPQ